MRSGKVIMRLDSRFPIIAGDYVRSIMRNCFRFLHRLSLCTEMMGDSNAAKAKREMACEMMNFRLIFQK